MKKTYFASLIMVLLISCPLYAQNGSLTGKIEDQHGNPVPFVNLKLKGTTIGDRSLSTGDFAISNIPFGSYTLIVSAIGYRTEKRQITITHAQTPVLLRIQEDTRQLDEIVITGTMKAVKRLASPVPVEVYDASFFQKNPTPSLFESLQTVNGVRPQLNCNICNTGDIHINGLEGPYTMITIDGMPIVSGLSTVYGLSGIPNSLIDRMEIVKGPASTLYGSEAVGGLINVITKDPISAPLFSADVFTTSWLETNVDLGMKTRLGDKTTTLLGINVFNYDNPIDNNDDGFTDLTIAQRISVFNKWAFQRNNNRLASIAARFIYEDRWGGEMNWTPEFRGGTEIYGESIKTERYELIGSYQLPIDDEDVRLSVSASSHHQDSYYGDVPYFAEQNIAFGQLTWSKTLSSANSLLTGLAMRYTFYDDNTPATQATESSKTKPSVTYMPGLFIQDEHKFNARNDLLTGIRYDYNSVHGHIFTPRLNYKYVFKNNNTLRISTGTGYRVANVFTEDHAALTGSRDVEFTEKLRPETSYNVNLNYVNTIQAPFGIVDLDLTGFHTFFTNKIQPDYDSDPNKIIYSNLDGHAVSQGISLNADVLFEKPLIVKLGMTIMNIYTVETDEKGSDIRERPVLAENFNGTWTATYQFNKGISVDYTGNVYGRMRLPLLGELDTRAEYSKPFSIQNIQVNKTFRNNIIMYGGIKNLLNFTPPANAISRPHDPFDKEVPRDQNGDILPDALTFDANYVYASNQGIRLFLGIKYNLF